MDDGAAVKLIEIADEMARIGQAMNPDPKVILERFRTCYRHLAATVETDSTDNVAASPRLINSAKDLESLK